MLKAKFVLLFLMLPFTGVFSQHELLLKDLRSQWLIHDGNNYRAFDELTGAGTNVIYIILEQSRYKGAVLRIENTGPFSIFINGKLRADHVNYWQKPADSLMMAASGPLVTVAVYTEELVRPHQLKTAIFTVLQQDVPSYEGPVLKGADPVQPFVIFGMITLALIIVLLVRLNIKHVSYYLSVSGVFSKKEADDSQALFRLGGSANLLFYVFAAMLFGYVLVLCLQDLGDAYSMASQVEASSWSGVILSWIKFSFIVLLCLLAKAVLTYSVAGLFSIPDQARIHFIDFVRFIILAMLVMGILASALFFTLNTSLTEQIYLAIGWALALWILILFLKMASRSRTSVFHLFSYICATEIIPFLLVVKVLYE